MIANKTVEVIEYLTSITKNYYLFCQQSNETKPLQMSLTIKYTRGSKYPNC